MAGVPDLGARGDVESRPDYFLPDVRDGVETPDQRAMTGRF